MKHFQNERVWGLGWGIEATAIHPSAYGSFLGVLGFLVIFRTSGAYGRFIKGAHDVDAMKVAYFEVAVFVTSFLKLSKKEPAAKKKFHYDIIRLLSLLNALCYSKLGDRAKTTETRLASLQVIDLDSLDADSLDALKDEKKHQVLLVYTWIHSMITDAFCDGEVKMIPVPAPVCGQILAKLSGGYEKFEDCRQTALVPFPFPYAQSTLWLLVLHWFVCPFAMCHLVAKVEGENNRFGSVFLFTLLQVFLLWSMVLTAAQLENPFGEDPNDLDLAGDQDTFNTRLAELTMPCIQVKPSYSTKSPIQGRSSLGDMFDKFDFKVEDEYDSDEDGVAYTAARALLG